MFASIEQFGGEATHFAREQVGVADALLNTLSARMWIDRLKPRQRPSRHALGRPARFPNITPRSAEGGGTSQTRPAWNSAKPEIPVRESDLFQLA